MVHVQVINHITACKISNPFSLFLFPALSAVVAELITLFFLNLCFVQYIPGFIATLGNYLVCSPGPSSSAPHGVWMVSPCCAIHLFSLLCNTVCLGDSIHFLGSKHYEVLQTFRFTSEFSPGSRGIHSNAFSKSLLGLMTRTASLTF